MENIVEKLVESVATHFVELVMHINRAISKRYLKKKSDLNYFSECLRRNSTELLEQSFSADINTWGVDYVAPLVPFLRVAVGIYKQSLSRANTVLVKLVEKYFENVE